MNPPHGWRAVFWELGIVTIGVLIALGAQQAVDKLRDHRIAVETRDAITQEINENLLNLQLRATAERCIARRLWELRALVELWGRTGNYQTPLWVAQTPSLDISLPHYDAAQSAGRLALLPREDQLRIGRVVDDLRAFQKIQDSEGTAWPDLRQLQSGADVLTATDRTIIRQALQRAAYLDYYARLIIRQALPAAAAAGFRPDMRGFDETAKHIWKSGRYTPSICAAIDTPPAQANELTGQQVPLPF
ncbi:MAG: hypothetical protein M3Q51_03605 [Pseudomonadota bacterium]|nr:hypothetical protein [Pseudomonadota bacterium]